MVLVAQQDGGLSSMIQRSIFDGFAERCIKCDLKGQLTLPADDIALPKGDRGTSGNPGDMPRDNTRENAFQGVLKARTTPLKAW